MRVYLDNAATTALDSEVMEAMRPYFFEAFGNASSLHGYGREALSAVDGARAKIAELLNCKPGEIYFTSGGSESDNWALRGAAGVYGKGGGNIITTSIEHPAIMKTCEELASKGYKITYLPVYSDGIVRAKDLENAVEDDTFLVSIMFANNEIGTIQPIAEIGEFCRKNGILFHTDAVQAAGTIKIDVKQANVDMLSLSAHKFHGPKGVGLLYVRDGVKLRRLIFGGEQERGYRAGTTNVPGIVGMAKALEISVRDMEKNNANMKFLRDYFIDEVLKKIPYCKLHGDRERRLCNNANFSFEFIEGESILINLDLGGVAVSSGSACSSGSLEPSYVILATGAEAGEAHSSIRFSFGRETTKEEVDYTIETLKKTVAKLRSWSPLFKEIKTGGRYV